MNAVTSRPRRPILLTAPTTWVRDGAVVGGLSAYLGAAVGLFGFTLHPWLLACAAAGVVVGALSAFVGRSFLEGTRGHVPLALQLVAMPVFATSIAAGIAVPAALLTGAPLAPGLTFSMTAAFVLTSIFWLPYTVCAVMNLPRWPVLVATVLTAPAMGPIAERVFMALL